MDRREAVLRVTGILGLTLSAPLLSGLLSGCNPQPNKEGAANGPLLIQNKHRDIISAIAEIIIPKTNTPGANEANVLAFILLMLADCYSLKQQEAFFTELELFDKAAAQKYGQGFLKCSPPEQEAFVLEEENKSLALVKEPSKSLAEEIIPFFTILKELTLIGYFTSEIGATQALQYDAVPGQFHGSVPLRPNQKAWAIS